MSTNLALNDELVESAKTLGQHRSKKDAVNTALEEYVRRLNQQAIIKSFGTVEYAAGYSHKQQRRKK